MEKTEKLLNQNYLTHKAKKAKQWDRRRKKAARIKLKNRNQIIPE